MRKLLHNEILSERLTIEEAKQVARHPVSLLLHNIRSSYNVGSIFRTADSALLSEIILCGFTPHPPQKEIAKTALGALDTVPWRYEKNILDAIYQEKNNGKKVIAVELTDKKRPYFSLDKSEFPLTLILGNEISGIDDYVLEHCDDAIDIPMYGLKHSLNVSVAAGIVTFEAIKLWNS
jgi:tRNA G18 (ribose-2'-O)-methylase SpoU